ncbi:MAG: helix-turn-helix transcriptional regulator [Gammaproteobacteria bacterium]|nr:helix-turn-helix transcriptional regulator [Gammaproteobacteria bacterium]
MDGKTLKSARVQARMTQAKAAARMGVSQPYLSMLEKGERAFTDDLARVAAKLFGLSPAVLPLPPASNLAVKVDPDFMARQLSGLGYPGYAHLRPVKANPAAVVLQALLQDDLGVRLSDALPWVLLVHHDLDWEWLVSSAKQFDAQNRLGFLVGMALELAEQRKFHPDAASALRPVLAVLERSRLAREDTLCEESMTNSERAWLRESRSNLARHWNLLCAMMPEDLTYVSERQAA